MSQIYSPRVISITPTIEATGYSDGDQLGGGSTKLSNVVDRRGGFTRLESIVIANADTEAPAIDFLFWRKAPTVSSAENAAFDVSDSVLAAAFIGKVNVATTDWAVLANNRVATVKGIGLLLQGNSTVVSGETGKDLWVSMVIRTAVTFASTTDLTILFGFVGYV